MTLEIIITACQGVFIVSLSVIGLFAKKYLSSYLQQKGRDLAIKENIKEITDKIESVKTQYTKSIEELKADLSIRNEQKLRILEKRNEALLKFHEDCHILTTEKLSMSLRFLIIKQLQVAFINQTFTENVLIKIVSDIIDYQSSILRSFTKVSVSATRIYLFYPFNNPSDEVVKSIAKLLSLIKSIQTIFPDKFSNLIKSVIEITTSSITNKSLSPNDIIGINTLISDYSKEIQPNINDLTEAIAQYVFALNNYFNEPGYKQFADQLSQK